MIQEAAFPQQLAQQLRPFHWSTPEKEYAVELAYFYQAQDNQPRQAPAESMVENSFPAMQPLPNQPH